MEIKKQYIYIGVAVSVVAIGLGIYLVKNNSKNKTVDLSVFDSPDQAGSGNCMNQEFIGMLQEIEKKTGYPIFDWINSGARSSYWNKRVGGVKNSAHRIPTCKAADIKTKTKEIRNNIVMAAKEVGFKRIGIGKTFVHLDNDRSKPQYVVWGYPSGRKPPINPFA